MTEVIIVICVMTVYSVVGVVVAAAISVRWPEVYDQIFVALGGIFWPIAVATFPFVRAMRWLFMVTRRVLERPRIPKATARKS